MANPPPPPGTAVQWIQKPQPIPGVPAGLEYFTQIDELMIEQKKSFMEVFTGWERNNKYAVTNAAGQQCFFAVEETDMCMRQCCGSQRGFIIKLFDNMQQEVMRFTRDFKCCTGCCWCAGACNHCAFLVKVEAPAGQVIGYVKQGGSFWKAHYSILDEAMEKVLELEGPCCVCDGPCCPCDNEFKLLTSDKTQQIGALKKVYAGFLTELATNADRFSINFPLDLSAKTKACLLGALFLIDFMFYEEKSN